MYKAIANDGTEITSDFNDWCGMFTRMHDIQVEKGVSEEDSSKMFWQEVIDSDPEEYERIIEKYKDKEDPLDYAIGDGSMDDMRNDYLFKTGYYQQCIEVDENGVEIGDNEQEGSQLEQ